MKANEIKRGDEVMYGNIEAVVLEPCINSVHISFMQGDCPKEKYVSYDSLTTKNDEDEAQ